MFWGIPRSINQSLVFLCQTSIDCTCCKESSLIFSEEFYTMGTLFLFCKTFCNNLILRGHNLNSIQQLLKKCCIKESLRRLSDISYDVVTKTYWALENKEILNLTISVLFTSCHYVVLGGYILNISKTLSRKLIFDLRLGDQLSDVPLQEFYVHPAYVIYQFYFYKISTLEKNKFCLLFEPNLPFFLSV